MKYTVYKQLELDPDNITHINDLSMHLKDKGIEHVVENNEIRGCCDGLKLVIYESILQQRKPRRKLVTEMRGVITTDTSDYISQRRATKVLTALAQYLPKNVKK